MSQEQPSQYPPNYQPQPQYTQYPPQQPPYYPPPQPPKKSRKGLWITLAIIAAVLVFGCIGISAAITNSAKGVVTNAIATTDTNSTTTSSSTIAKVGQTITLDGVQATLTSVKTHAGTDFDKPKAGNEYVIVHVKMHNTE
jgi:flagellar basal body-associated protein FliL